MPATRTLTITSPGLSISGSGTSRSPSVSMSLKGQSQHLFSLPPAPEATGPGGRRGPRGARSRTARARKRPRRPEREGRSVRQRSLLRGGGLLFATPRRGVHPLAQLHERAPEDLRRADPVQRLLLQGEVDELVHVRCQRQIGDEMAQWDDLLHEAALGDVVDVLRARRARRRPARGRRSCPTRRDPRDGRPPRAPSASPGRCRPAALRDPRSAARAPLPSRGFIGLRDARPKSRILGTSARPRSVQRKMSELKGWIGLVAARPEAWRLRPPGVRGFE